MLLSSVSYSGFSFFFLIASCLLSRDGVSESQFNQVLNMELDQIIEVSI